MSISPAAPVSKPKIVNKAALAAFKDEKDEPRMGLMLVDGVLPVAGTNQGSSSEEPDSLDVFMAGITAEVAKPTKLDEKLGPKAKAAWEELQPEDPVASYCEAFEKGSISDILTISRRKVGDDSDENGDDGDDTNDSAGDEEKCDRRLKPIEPLAHKDHSKIVYEEVQMDFYTPHPDIAKLTEDEVKTLRSELRVSALGSDVPRPAVSFAHLGLPSGLMEGIRRHGYTKPTPIQAQAIPAGLKGRDVIGVAETGSGKTVAYLMPMLVHCANQRALEKGEGPIGLVLCPTRELAVQIEKETFKFNKTVGLRSTTLAGGLSKLEQFKTVKSGTEIVIATPGRIIDIVKMKGCNLHRCTVVVLDEADRMLQMGFEYQVRSVVQNVRPARQTLLFSATMPPKVEHLTTQLQHQPVRIIVGKRGQAATSVSQTIEVLPSDEAKWAWLSEKLERMLVEGQVLLFTGTKQGAEALCQQIIKHLYTSALVLHGDVDQDDRARIMDKFRKRKSDVLIATDLAARGLDVPAIHTVVSFDVARDIETHTHRVGRTGRAGVAGVAHTLLTQGKHDRKMAASLVTHLQQAGAPVEEKLLALAMQYPQFCQARGQEEKALSVRSTSWACIEQDVVTDSRARSRSRSPHSSSPPPTP